MRTLCSAIVNASGENETAQKKLFSSVGICVFVGEEAESVVCYQTRVGLIKIELNQPLSCSLE